MNTLLETRAILFSDIAGSTRLYETLGDEAARRIVADALDRMSDAVLSHRGTVVKTIGDELLCSFPDAESAVAAARAIHRVLRDADAQGHGRAHARIGVHLGPVLHETGDVFGDTVNHAARLVAAAPPDRIVVSEDVRAALSVGDRDSVRPFDLTTLKGISGLQALFEVVWEETEMTFLTAGAPAFRIAAAELTLTAGARAITIGPTRSTASIGRLDHNDLVVADPRVSRTHVRVEYRRGHFVLTDLSSNGTFLVPEGGTVLRLHHAEEILEGTGRFALGEAVPAGDALSIGYAVSLPRDSGP